MKTSTQADSSSSSEDVLAASTATTPTSTSPSPSPSPSPQPSRSHSLENASVFRFVKANLDHLNSQLEHMHPLDILRFSRVLFPNLYQTTAFGLTGLVILDMLSRLQQEASAATPPPPAKPSPSRPVDVVFLDTLHHFQETYDLVDRVRQRYPDVRFHVYRPLEASTAAEFEATYGARLYETSAELYDWAAKVEPQQRAMAELGVGAVLTGRRRSQGGQRGALGVLELDEDEDAGVRPAVVKINPLAAWSFEQVRAYVREHQLPYNALLDRGYKSVGDWHSTSPVAEGEDERAGRWKGQSKTECGIHNKKGRYAQFLQTQNPGPEQLTAA